MGIFNKLRDKINNNVIVNLEKTESSILKKLEDNRIKIDSIETNFNHIVNNKIIENFKKQNDIANFDSDYERLKKDSTSHKVLIAGFFGAVNTGDELMLNALLSNISEEAKKHYYILVSNNEELIPSYKYPGYKYIRYPMLTSQIERLSDQFDTVIWAGGAHLDDTNFQIGQRQISYADMYIYLSITMLKKGKNVYSLSLSSNKTLNNKKYIEYLKYIVENSNYFSVRDKNSAKTVEEACNLSKKIKIDNDLIFADKLFIEKKLPKIRKKKTITIINILNNDTFDSNKKLIEEINEYFSGKYEIRLLDFYNYHGNDEYFINKMIGELDGINISYHPLIDNLERLSEFLLESDYVFSQRYHGILLSNLLGINTIAIYYENHPHYYNKVHGIYDLYRFEKNILNYNHEGKYENIKTILDHLGKQTNKVDSKKEFSKSNKLIIDILKETRSK